MQKEGGGHAKLAEQRSDRNAQYSRLWNLKILFVPEKPGKAPETPEESKKEALRVFHELLGLKHITPEHLDAVHRVGERKQNTARPVVGRFVSKKKKKQTRGVTETAPAQGPQPQSGHCRRTDKEQLPAFFSSVGTPWNPASMD